MTLDDLPDAQYQAVESAIKIFRSGKKDRTAQHELYEVMTNMGLSAEYADEYINLEMES